MIERFDGCAQGYPNVWVLILCRVLIDNVLELRKMLKRPTKILETED
jgi:hypothetical protein